MKDIVTQLYHLVDEELPVIPLKYDAENSYQNIIEDKQKLLENFSYQSPSRRSPSSTTTMAARKQSSHSLILMNAPPLTKKITTTMSNMPNLSSN